MTAVTNCSSGHPEREFIKSVRQEYLTPYEHGISPVVAANVYSALVIVELRAISATRMPEFVALQAALQNEHVHALPPLRETSAKRRDISANIAIELSRVLARLEEQFCERRRPERVSRTELSANVSDGELAWQSSTTSGRLCCSDS